MDWRRYLKTEEGHGDPSPGEPAEEEATEEVVFLQRSLSLTERTRLGLSEAWYSWVERFGLQRLRSIVSGVATLPETDEPLYLLGKRYETLNRGEKEDEKEEDDAQQRAKERTEAFAEDLGSRAWVTYRSGFSPLGPSLLTNDAGWGCTIRSGQMLLANCLLVHHKGREWRRRGGEASTSAGHDAPPTAEDIFSLFHDHPGMGSPLSLHNVIKEGAGLGIAPGRWVGPHGLCQAVRRIFTREEARRRARGGAGINVAASRCELSLSLYLAADAGGIPTLYRSRAVEEATCGSEGAMWRPLLILVPVTLGCNSSYVNPCYVPQILTVLSTPQSVGIVGGKPGSSIYVLGRQGDRILYLDPHTLKPSVSGVIHHEGAQNDGVGADSYFCDSVHHMLCARLDPSLALGFYCRERRDLDDLYERLGELSRKHPTTSIVSLAEEPEPEKDYDAASTDVDGFQLY